MERLTFSRRPKTGDKVDFLPAGDVLPIWTTIPLDAKFPMMHNPKGSVILCTTKLGQPKHQCKQEYDFDLRDPNGKYISNIYHPLHDPHLKSYFRKEVMRRHLIKKGFISGDDGKVLCSLREFNQYRQYLRHIFFLEIAKERKEELENRARANGDEKTVDQRKPASGTALHKRLQERERAKNDLKINLNQKADRFEKCLKALREEMIEREKKQREDTERRYQAIHRNQQEAEQRNLMMIKRWRKNDRSRGRLIEDRHAQKQIQAEMKCLEKWNERKVSQKEKLERQSRLIQEEHADRLQSIANRERMVKRHRETLERKLEALKERTRERKRKRDALYAKRFEEKLASGDYRKWCRTQEKRNKHRQRFNSSWSLQNVLNDLQVSDYRKEDKADATFLEPDTDGLEDIGKDVSNLDIDEEETLRKQAREIVDGVVEKVKNEIYPAYLKSIGEEKEDPTLYDATISKSVRFSADEDEIKPEPAVNIEVTYDFDLDINIVELSVDKSFRPVAEHIVTPCPSQLEVRKLESGALLGSDEIGDKANSVTFVETLLLRLLDDLNSGRLRKEDIMKLASYSMEIIQSTESESLRDSTILEEFEFESRLAASSSSAIIAQRLVDFTLCKILSDIQSGNVHHDDLASLTVSLVDISGGGDEGSISVSVSDADLDEYIGDTLRAATSSAMDPREDTPICEALLDNFMVNTLKRLIKDLEDEALTREQIEALAKSVKDETKVLTESSGFDLENVDDIRFVLLSLLTQLKTGDIESQTLYQIVFAIVYSYSMIKGPPTSSYINTVTGLLKEVLNKAEEQASSGKFDIVNKSIIHEANSRLSNTNLDMNQIEKISSGIMTLSARYEVICKTRTSQIARSVVEDALVKAKAQIMKEEVDKEFLEGIENIAESVITALTSESRSPPLVDVFVEILEQLKESIQKSEQFDEDKFKDFCDLINLVESHSIGPDDVADMATSVAELMKNAPKSDLSETAFHAVKDTLKSIKDDFIKGIIEENIIKDMIDIIHLSFKSTIALDPKSPALLSCLADFIRSILSLLSSKLQSGEFDQADLIELSSVLKRSFEAKSIKSENNICSSMQTLTKSPYTEVDTELGQLLGTDNVLDYLSYLIDNIETGEMKPEEIHDLGTRLIESGKGLMTSLGEKVSSISTDDAAERAVEEVLRTIQMEIESGILTKDSLKEMTKSIIISSSDSDFADELISGTIRNMDRDVQRGYDIKNIPSLPSLDHSPSASTIASYIIVQTIDEIKGYLSEEGLPKGMLGSVASSILSFLSDGRADIGTLPTEFEQHRNTITNIIACLRDDQISVKEAEKLFCVILETYKDYRIEQDVKVKQGSDLSTDDTRLIEDLVNETMRNIERSVASGKIFDKEFSLPSAASSHNTSQVASNLVETCLHNIKQHLEEEENTKSRRAIDIVDFIISIIQKLHSELSEGMISSLAMTTFVKAISSEREDLKEIETNALDDLSVILSDIKSRRLKSIYIDRIIDTYLTPDRTSIAALADPVKAVESILVSVSSEILTKFVKATLESLILDMRDRPSAQGLETTSSVYVFRTTSSIVAENVIKNVISKIKNDLGDALKDKGATMSKHTIERAASKLLTSEGQGNGSLGQETSNERLHSLSTYSSSIPNKATEDIVLETLHNIVSNLRFEQSLQSQDRTPNDDESASEASQEVHDFVLQTLQNIVTDLQDKRSQNDLGDLKTESTIDATGNVLASKDSIMATSYVNEVLHTVLHDMKSDMSTRSSNSTSREQKLKIISPLNIESSIVDTLINVLSGTSLNKHPSLLEQKQKDHVKKIFAESIKRTILHIKNGLFNSGEMFSMYESLSKCVEDEVCQASDDLNASNLQSIVISILLSLSLKIESLSVNDEMLNKLSSHLATVGMEAASESTSTVSDATNNSSVKSSEISDLVQDIISKISQQLVEEDNVKNEGNKQELNSTSDDNTEHDKVTDINFNRRNSVSSSCTSTLNKDNSDTSITSLNVSLSKRKSLGVAKANTKGSARATETMRKTNRRSSEQQAVIAEQSQGRYEEKCLNHRSLPKPHIQYRQGAKIAKSSKETGNSKVKKDTPVPARYRQARKSNKMLYPKCQKGLSTYTHSSTPIRTTEFKPRLTSRQKLRSPDLSKMSQNDSLQKIPIIPESRHEIPLELQSLCGGHKTRIKYRTTIENQSDSTTDDGSYTSELF